MSLTIKQINQHRCSLLSNSVIGNLITNWYTTLFPTQTLTSVQIEQISTGGLFDSYCNAVLITNTTIYMVRFYLLYIPTIQHDLFQYLNTLIHIREKLEQIQEDNQTLLLEGNPVLYQNVPYPFNIRPPAFTNQVVMLLHSRYDEKETGIDYKTTKQLFSSRGIQLIQYNILS
jgi:hypothetical protein